jgi:hypothetical protein
MNTSISIALLAGGIVLVVLGFIAMDSVSSSFSRFFTGTPTDKSMWLLIAGVVLIAVSGFGMLRGSQKSD